MEEREVKMTIKQLVVSLTRLGSWEPELASGDTSLTLDMSMFDMLSNVDSHAPQAAWYLGCSARKRLA